MIKTSYDSKEEIPQGFESLYTEQGGKWVLTGVDGMKTQTDVDNVKKALTAERQLKKDLENKLSAFEGVEADGLREQLDELARLRTTGGKVDDANIEQIVAERLKLDKSSYENKLAKMAEEMAAKEDKINNLVNAQNKSLIEGKLREAANGKVNDSAINDVLFRASLFEVSEEGKVVTKENGVTPTGLEPGEWLEETLKTNTHWQKQSSGAGASGNNGSRSQTNSKEPMSLTEIMESELSFK